MNCLVGIDGGGTSCRALVASPDGKVLGKGRAGAANIMTNLDGSFKNIMKSVKRAARDADIPEAELANASAVLGLAGADTGNRNEQVLKFLPFANSRITTDGQIALYGALQGKDGAIGILGTGSVFLSRNKSRRRKIGGWGFAVGDLCSGARLGRALLQEVLLAHDRVQPGSPLTETVMARFSGSPDEIVEFAQTATPGDFGKLAPLVFSFEQQGDLIAVAIVKKAMRDLEASLRTLTDEDKLPFCLLGGLAGEYSRRLPPALKERKRYPANDAPNGAVQMAASLFGNDRKNRARRAVFDR